MKVFLVKSTVYSNWSDLILEDVRIVHAEDVEAAKQKYIDFWDQKGDYDLVNVQINESID